jgi:hypothetical protein
MKNIAQSDVEKFNQNIETANAIATNSAPSAKTSSSNKGTAPISVSTDSQSQQPQNSLPLLSNVAMPTIPIANDIYSITSQLISATTTDNNNVEGFSSIGNKQQKS